LYRRLFSVFVIVVAAVVVTEDRSPLPLPAPVVEAASDYCMTQLTFQNDRRRVKGSLDQECGVPGIPWFLEHSPPWGNWGVNSNYGRRSNGFQWAGWNRLPGHDPWHQWSTCTRGRFAPPNPQYYNDGGGRTQKAAPDNTAYARRAYVARPPQPELRPALRQHPRLSIHLHGPL